MVETKRLLEDLKRLLKRLEDDLRERMASVPEMADRLRAEYHAARDAARTGAAFEAWREEVLTQAAAAWVLGSVLVRFLEDNALVDGPLISGPGSGGAAPPIGRPCISSPTPRTPIGIIYDVFRTVGRFPAVAKLYDEGHNPV